MLTGPLVGSFGAILWDNLKSDRCSREGSNSVLPGLHHGHRQSSSRYHPWIMEECASEHAGSSVQQLARLYAVSRQDAEADNSFTNNSCRAQKSAHESDVNWSA